MPNSISVSCCSWSASFGSWLPHAASTQSMCARSPAVAVTSALVMPSPAVLSLAVLSLVVLILVVLSLAVLILVVFSLAVLSLAVPWSVVLSLPTAVGPPLVVWLQLIQAATPSSKRRLVGVLLAWSTQDRTMFPPSASLPTTISLVKRPALVRRLRLPRS